MISLWRGDANKKHLRSTLQLNNFFSVKGVVGGKICLPINPFNVAYLRIQILFLDLLTDTTLPVAAVWVTYIAAPWQAWCCSMGCLCTYPLVALGSGKTKEILFLWLFAVNWLDPYGLPLLLCTWAYHKPLSKDYCINWLNNVWRCFYNILTGQHQPSSSLLERRNHNYTHHWNKDQKLQTVFVIWCYNVK